ncbi:MAG: hypothetical protein HY084_05835 [Gemmatimonadetes bacterium]|nr:hypothetical protein [Gemmatimonadota bacterium]
MNVALVLATTMSLTRAVPTAAAPPPVDAASARAFATVAAMARTPTFARQMKLSCNVCHLGGFPQLTRFGRLFKLNGYTLTGLPQITDMLDSATRQTLSLAPIPGLSAMAIVSATSVAKALPGTAATRSEFPQQLSLFFGGSITPNVGALTQLTYSDVTGKLAIDNTDVRFTAHTKLADRDVIYGLTLHNNPTVQDVWNTLPAWGYPFTSAALAPRPAASTLLEGGLAQAVVGVGAYALYDNVLYAEVSGYTSAPQGPRSVVDSTETNLTHGIAPYWRIALQNRNGPVTAMVGTYGLSADLSPRGAMGAYSTYSDVGVDAQLESAGDAGAWVARASYTVEHQSLAGALLLQPPAAANTSNTLRSLRASAFYAPTPLYGLSAMYFATSGTSDAVMYAPNAVTGSSTGSPNTAGQLIEFSYNPWINTRLGLQYVRYDKFNGSSTSYDLRFGGRNAADNNTLYTYVWFAF